MIIKTLDGHEVKWRPKNGKKENCSALHLRARHLLKVVYPTVSVLEEVSIPIRKRKNLFLDFYIPIYNLAIEVDGSQHFSYSKFFHGSKRKFSRAMDNDYYKEEFCNINNITLVRFKYNESIDRWKELLL